ncbi:hypothetical protein PABG_12453 [Paracoccidioides brasiliensis Pb03]|nr:hypothetical protein PABG_12453 [Paracoccidioides brasiliensis Pb03]ODH13439.1 hypothetical protein ACO22_07260 [Paracoccidioides brasiliensis]ODH46281.1 hypothetical protein GX48_07623 [Paracoccidioides brasiliensis]
MPVISGFADPTLLHSGGVEATDEICRREQLPKLFRQLTHQSMRRGTPLIVYGRQRVSKE